MKTATHTAIHHTQPAIPGRLLLSRACFRLTGQWHCYHLFDYCQVVIHHDAVLVQREKDIVHLRLREYLAFGKEVFSGIREFWITILRKCVGRPV